MSRQSARIETTFSSFISKLSYSPLITSSKASSSVTPLSTLDLSLPVPLNQGESPESSIMLFPDIADIGTKYWLNNGLSV